MKAIIASVFALGLLGASVLPADAHIVYVRHHHYHSVHYRHCTAWGWHHHNRVCRFWRW